jgi:hypothetical protein
MYIKNCLIRYLSKRLKQGDALSPLLFKFALEYAIRKVWKNQTGLKLNGTLQLVIDADEMNLLGDNITTITKHTGGLTDSSKEVILVVTAERIRYMSSENKY